MIEILVILVLILMNGLFSMFEIALVSSRKTRLEERSRSGNRGASVALMLLKKPEEILSSIQVGITLVGIVSGAYGGVAFSADLTPLIKNVAFLATYAEELAFISVVGIITYFSLIIGELVPKTIALNNPERIAILFAPFMRIVGKIVYPLVWILSYSTKLVMRVIGIKENLDPPVTEEELRMLLKQGSEHGVIEQEESVIINEVIRVGDKRAGSIMTHRTEVKWLDSNESVSELLDVIKSSEYTKMPVCNKSMDNILGVVNVKSLLVHLLGNESLNWEKMITEPLYIPEQIPALNVLELFRKRKNHFAVVINEYGSTEGIITLHDIVENIMGDLPQEESEQLEMFERQDGSFIIDGSMKIEDVFDHLSLGITPDKLTESYGGVTIGGLAMFKLKRIPKTGDQFTIGGYIFEIVDMDGNRVDKLLVIKE